MKEDQISRTPKFALRFLALLCAATLLSVALGPAAPSGGPYASALSALTTGSALASPSCQNRACSFDISTLKYRCVKSDGTTCAAYNSNGPVASKCIENAC